MTPEEITAMAKAAHGPITSQWWDMDVAALQRFAALVAEKAAAQERERFAPECIDLVAFHGGSVELEAAIRARGQKGGV